MNNYKVFIDGVEIKQYVHPSTKLLHLLHKLGLKAQIICVIKPIEVLGRFEVAEL